jgi:hypothetical protein
MTWFAVGSAAIGAGASLFGSSKAKKAQKKAAKDALALQESQYNTTRDDNMPALQARNNALYQQQTLAQKYGNGVPSAEDVMNTPGYQFGLTQGRNALEGSAAAKGGLYSGRAGKDLVQYGNDYGTTKYNDAFNRMQSAQTNDFNRWASVAGQGQTGSNTIANAGQNYANNGSNIGIGLGNAYGASAVANSNVLGNFANQAGSALKGWWNSPASFQATPGLGGNGAGGSPDGYFAMGGPVLNSRIDPNAPPSGGSYAPYSSQAPQRPRMGIPRMGFRPRGYADGGRVEPTPGTQGPAKKGGTGGGLNDLKITIQVPQQQEPRANPLNPRAVLDAREGRANLAGGGEVDGPGGPMDDAIPAQLSNGEHVFDEASVTALGDGDNELGQLRLNKLRAMLKGAM